MPLAEDDGPSMGLIRQANQARILGAGERVFARAGLHGATMAAIADEAGALMRGELRAKVQEKAAVIDTLVAAGRMAPVDATHLFFMFWAANQTYADFEVQVCAVLGHKQLTAADHVRATAHVVGLVLRGCGLA